MKPRRTTNKALAALRAERPQERQSVAAKIRDGLSEALAVARGEKTSARVTRWETCPICNGINSEVCPAGCRDGKLPVVEIPSAQGATNDSK